MNKQDIKCCYDDIALVNDKLMIYVTVD